MIALSIAAVAAENLFVRTTVTRRWIVSFCFGLVHGFGFSSALRELGLPAQGLAALAASGSTPASSWGRPSSSPWRCPLLVLCGGRGWERRVIWGSSLAILLVGLVLFVERAFL